jgi:MFS transporter, MHS family, shikimate and dehydroshikimate transport protein
MPAANRPTTPRGRDRGLRPVSGEPAVTGAMLRRVAFASCIGTTVEWYDFFIYATAAALVFNKLFFPNFDPLVGSLVALGTYAAGFVARPIGGLVFGVIGDRSGRKVALVTTLLIVGIATFVIGLMPTYATIGIAAPLTLLFIRLLHGFGIGGEQGNAILITFEHAPAESRGFFGSWVQIGAPAGFVLPLGLFAILTATMSDATFLAWGWRIPFLLSVLLIGIGLYIRLNLTESPLFKSERRHEPHPLRTVFREHRRKLLLGCGAKLLESTVFTTYAVLITAYAVNRGIPKSVMTTATLIAILIELVTIPAFGALSDRIGRRPVYFCGALLNVVLAFPVFWLVYTGRQDVIWLGLVAVIAVGHSAMYGPQAAFFAELFPTRLRATGISFVQQIGALIGSVGGLAAGWLLALGNGTPWLLAGYVVLVGLITLVCTFLLRESAPRVVGGEPGALSATAA